MSVGKYSPTVSASYTCDQQWWEKNGGGYGNGKYPDLNEDDDGYDSYGYSGDCGNGPDRAGNTERDYLSSYANSFKTSGELGYHLYEEVSDDWSGVLAQGKNSIVREN